MVSAPQYPRLTLTPVADYLTANLQPVGAGMDDPEQIARLRALDERITRAKAALNPPRVAQDHHSIAQVGWRMVIELVTGLVLGAGIGYGLDVLLGTLPLFLVLFTLLGFAAGIRTMLGSARELGLKQDRNAPQATGAEEEDKTSGR
jgi:ATP synthase protein I